MPQAVTTFVKLHLLHGMRDMRERVALVIKSCSSDLEFALEHTEEHVVRKKSPDEAGSVQMMKAPRHDHHQPPTTKVASRDNDAGRARESRNVRADRTAYSK